MNILVIGTIDDNSRYDRLTPDMKAWWRKKGRELFPEVHLVTEAEGDADPELANVAYQISWKLTWKEFVVGIREQATTNLIWEDVIIPRWPWSKPDRDGLEKALWFLDNGMWKWRKLTWYVPNHQMKSET